ncbi:hypothetical protein LNO81_05705 [Klebsiella variicola subsp. variicola]|nr:hypothetical protein [Klebsiella variicola subsp. variicola]
MPQKEQYNNLPDPSLRLSVMSPNLFFKFFVPHTTTQMPFSGASRHIALCRPSLVYTQNPSRYIEAVAKPPAASLTGKRPKNANHPKNRGEKDEA